MRIAVLVKVVPDTYGERRITLETGLIDRAAAPVVDEIGERAVEAAVTLAEETPGTEVIVVIMGPESAADPGRKLLALGADRALHVVDDGLVGADLTLTAEVLTQAVRDLDPDLVLLGNVSTDGGGGVLGAMIAESLAFAQATYLTSISSDGRTIRGRRVQNDETLEIEASLPAVASITEALPDPRFPSMRDTMAARRKSFRTVSAAELGVDVADEESPRAVVLAASRAPERGTGVKIVDDGTSAAQLADFLFDRSIL